MSAQSHWTFFIFHLLNQLKPDCMLVAIYSECPPSLWLSYFSTVGNVLRLYGSSQLFVVVMSVGFEIIVVWTAIGICCVISIWFVHWYLSSLSDQYGHGDWSWVRWGKNQVTLLSHSVTVCSAKWTHNKNKSYEKTHTQKNAYYPKRLKTWGAQHKKHHTNSFVPRKYAVYIANFRRLFNISISNTHNKPSFLSSWSFFVFFLHCFFCVWVL